MTKFSDDEIEELLAAPDYRALMVKIIERTKGGKWGMYSALSKKAGFASRSFVRDIILGKRRITAKTVGPIAVALELSGELQTYFKLLVGKSEVDVRTPGLTDIKIDKKLSKIRYNISKRNFVHPAQQKILSQPLWPEIFACLGQPDIGSTVDEIQKRTGIAKDILAHELNKMVVSEAVQYNSEAQKYFGSNLHIDAILDEESKTFLLRSTDQLGARIAKNFKNSDELFWRSIFSMKSDRAVQFKSELRELLLRFVDHAEDPDGDTVFQIFLTFESARH